MPLRLTLGVCLALAVASPAAAQTPPAAPAAAPADINQAAETWRAQVEAMNREVAGAVQAAGSNRRRALSRVNAILDRYTPGFEAFAVQLDAWFEAQAAAAPTDAARAAIRERAAESLARVRGQAAAVRAGLSQRAAIRERPDQSRPPSLSPPPTGYSGY